MVRFVTRFAFVAGLLFVAPGHADADPSTKSGNLLPNFRQVTSSLWRSGRPLPDGIKQLATQGLKLIVDLEDDDVAIAAEAKLAASLGIKHVSLPISSGQKITDALVNQALVLLRESDAYPVLVHCYAGEDRTGMVVGMYRVMDQGYTPAAAYQEMLRNGFHQSWKELDEYFHQRTGLRF